jgi:competence protein ComEC
MYFWIPYAFVRIVVFFMAGILIGIFVPFSIPLLPVVTLFFLSAMAYVLMAASAPIRKVANPGFVGLFCILTAGYLNVQLQTESKQPDHLSKLESKPQFYRAVISAYVQEKDKSWKAEARVEQVRVNGKWNDCQGKVLLYFSKDFPVPPAYGDKLLVKGNPYEVKGPLNPGEFDYRKFLSYRNIHHQQFLRPGQVIVIGNAPPNVLMGYAIEARIWADQMLAKYVAGGREQAIASALVLGITDGLDNELLTAYGATGTLHVLAVSGLHISIIYMIILALLAPLNKSTSGKWIIAVISIAVLWAYAFVTGLSPSVLRAVTMFTFVALAKPWKQKVNIYNSLAASAFLLLLFDPPMIMSVGFQLSYLAVLGIVYLHPKLYQWWEPDSRILDEIWKITSVSIAAQVATLPLCLLYFHQFPNYFLISNLLVIPASFVVLVAGLLILALSYITVLAKLVGWILMWTVKIMNVIVFTIEDLPFSKLDNILLTPFQGLVLAMMMACFLLMLDQRKFYYAWMLLFLVCIFSGSRWWYDYQEFHRQRLVVYHVPDHTAIDLIDGMQASSIADAALMADHRKIGFHIQPGRMQYGVESSQLIDHHNLRVVNGGRMMIWQGKVILLVEGKMSLAKPMKVDYLIISRNATRDLQNLAFIDAKKIILDSSNSFYLAERLLEQGRGLNKNIYSVRHQGAYHETM